MRPVRRSEREPVAEGLQAEVEQPFRLTLFLGDEADHILVEAGRDDVGVDVCDETVLILAAGSVFEQLGVILLAGGTGILINIFIRISHN